MWNTGENGTRELVSERTDLVVFDAGVAANSNTMDGSGNSIQDLKITTPAGLITIDGMSTLTLAGGGFVMGNDSMQLATEAVQLLAEEQSRNAESVPPMANGAIQGAEVNLSRIGFGDLTLGRASMFAGAATIADEPLSVPANFKAAGGIKMPNMDFVISGIGAAPRVSPRLERVKFNEDSGVAGTRNQGAKKAVKISVRNSVKPAITDGATLDLRAAMELRSDTSPLPGTVGVALSDSNFGNTDGGIVKLSAVRDISISSQNGGRLYVTSRLLPLVSPPATPLSISFTFGDGTQNGNGSGPGAISNHWNNVDAWPMPDGVEDITPPPTLPWSLSYWQNGSNRGNNTFGGHMTVNIGETSATQTTRISDGSTLATPMTLTYDDPGTVTSFQLNSEYGSGPVIQAGLGTQPYNQKQVYWSSGYGVSLQYFEFGNIPIALFGGAYNVFVGGTGFGSPVLTNLTSPTFRLQTPQSGRHQVLTLQYIQFVEAPTTVYWAGATSGDWSASPSNFSTDLAGTVPMTGPLARVHNVIFNATTAANFANTTLGADQTLKTLTFASNASSAIAIGGTNTLTILPSSSTTGIMVESLSGNHTISAKVALGADQTWTVTDAGQILTVSGVVSGASMLDKAGAGTLVLSASNTYSGATTIDAGTLQLGNGGTTGSISPANNLTNNGALAINRSNTATQGSDFGLITGTGGFTQAGGGTTILNLANTYTGATKISTGTLSAGADANLGNANALIFDGGTLQIRGTTLTSYTAGLIGTHAVSLNANKNVGFDISSAANTFTVDQILNQGTGGLTKSGLGTLVLTGANSYSGLTAVNSGTVVISGSPTASGATTVSVGLLKLDYGTNNTSKLADGAAFTIAGGTLELAGGSHIETVGSSTIATGVSSVTRSSGSSVLRMNVLTRNTGGYINFTTSGIASTSTANDATGILGIWATVGGTDWAMNSGTDDGGAVGNSLITAYTGYANVDAQAGGAAPNIVDGANTNVRIQSDGVSGSIGLSAATTTVNTLLKNNTNFATTVATVGKILRVNAIMLNPTAEKLTIGAAPNDGTLSSATSTGSPDLRLINNSAGKTLTINAVIANNTVASTLTKSGAGMLVLGGTNTYTGATTISGGTLSVGASANLGNANPLILDGGILQITGTTLTSYGSGAIGTHPVTLTAGKTVGLDINNVANTFTVSQVLNQGDGGLTKLGTGTLVLSGANTFVGPTTLSAGTLSVGADNNLGNTSAFVFDGGTLQVTGTTLNNFGVHTPSFNSGKAVGLDINNAANTFIVSQIMNQGIGGLTKLGAGTLALGGANTYSGTTTLNAGALRLDISTSLGTSTLVINGGTLDSGAANLVNTNNNAQSWNANFTFAGTNSLDMGTGAVALVGATTPRAVTVSANTLSVGGVISGTTTGGFSFGLNKVGPGTLVLTGANTFAGASKLTDGILSVGLDANLGNANTWQFAGGTLQITGTALTSYDANGKIGNHTFTLLANTLVGLDINNVGNTFTVDKPLTQGTGGLTKSGGGTLVFTGANTYTGVTTLNAGTLSVGSISNGGVSSNLGAATNVATNLVFNGGGLRYTGSTGSTDRAFTINAGKTATFDITQAGTNLTVSGASPSSTGGALIKNGLGTLTLAGSLGYTGATNVSGGALSFGNGSGPLSALTTSGITLANSSNVTFNHSDTATFANVISGSGSFTKSGAGTLTLNATQNYDGATLIDGGTLKLHSDPGFRYYRFLINSLVASDLAQMAEFAFYSSGTNNVNGTRVIPTTATGDGGNYGDQLIPALSDNNQNTKCTYNGLPGARYVTFDFGTTTFLSGYDWQTANDSTPGRNPNNFSVLGSNDNTNFTLLSSQTNAGNTPTTTFTWATGWSLGLVGGQNLLPVTTNVTIAGNGVLALDGASQQLASLSGASSASVTNSGIADVILTINGTTTTTFSGIISNGATNKITLVKNGVGTQILAGNNTYTGATTINTGTLQLGDGGTTGAISPLSALTDNGTLIINRSNTATQGVDFGLITGTGGFVQAGSGTTIFNQTNTYSGTTVVNAGTLKILASISGDATVNGGALAINGAISGTTTVNSGGTLAGDNGALANVNINSGGTLSPGGGVVGSLTVNGDLNLNGSAIFIVQFDSTAIAVDTIALNGNLNIASGATLNVSDIGSNPSSIFDVTAPIITYSGTWNGVTFMGLPDDSYFMSAGQAYQISYDGGVVTLTMVAAVPEPGAAVSLLGGLGLLLGVRRRRA